MAPTTKSFVFSVIVIPLFLLPFCSGCLPSEREALLRFKSALNYSSWEETTGDCCLWPGISCHNTTNHVVAVDIYGYYDDITGYDGVEGGGIISESLCGLTYLATIRLTSMGLTGTVPPCLGNLSSLSVLDLYSNNLDGESVLDDICKLRNLSMVDLSHNRLNGSLPSCLGSLSSLVGLHLSGNRLTGNIPLSSSLATLNLRYNNFQGETLLTTICLLSNLSRVYLSYNQLNGSLPSCLSSLSSVTHVEIRGNLLTGNIPHSLGKMSSLKGFDVSNNFLSGSIPDSLGNLSLLEYLELPYNQLSGSIPDSLGNLSLLEYLELSDNQLSGSIPDSLGNLSLLSILHLSYNQLNGTLPSFLRLSSLTDLFAYGNALSLGITSLALPSSLQYLTLSLDGQVAISETFFYNLTKLENLALSNCVHNISTTWIPSFQLTWLSMTSCKVDGRIPSWISTQFSLVELKLVDNNLTGEIPSWLLGMNLLFHQSYNKSSPGTTFARSSR